MKSGRYSAFFFFLRRYRRIVVGIFLMTMVGSVLESLTVLAFFPIFSSLLSTSAESQSGILRWVLELVKIIPLENPLLAAGVLLVGMFLFKIVFTVLRELLVGYASAKVMYEVKKEVMDGYAAAHYQFILNHKQGTLLYNSQDAPGSVMALMLTGSGMIMTISKIISLTVVLILILPTWALAVIILGMLYYALVHVLSNKVSFRIGRLRAGSTANLLVVANEFFSGFRQIVTLNATRNWLDRFDNDNRALRNLTVLEVAWAAVPRPIMEVSIVALMLAFLLSLWVAGPDTLRDSLPAAGVFGVALIQLMNPLAALGSQRMKLMGAMPNANIVYQAITENIPRRVTGHRTITSFEHGLVFDNVSFAHQDREPLFRGFNLIVEKGQVTAIVGASGAGKTTVVNLILGLFEPTGGQITVDGVPLSEINQDSWLSMIGFVSQDTFTYHSTVTDNILLGRNGHSQESIVRAAKIAHAHEFVSELPQGYDTIIGERGLKLSGGQQQRLAIARAVLDFPQILIFDEATSSLDTISEKLVQEAIQNASIDRTVIVVAHRLSTIRHADKIIVLDAGQVVEEGDHEELLNRHGQYSRLVGLR